MTPPAEEAYAQFRATSRFGSLDGLRCLSILSVMWFHGPGHVSGGLGSRGYLGVQLFFAISGFLIPTLLLRERATTGGISLTNFYARRSLRIFPLYYAVLGIYVALVALTARHSQAGQTFFNNLPYFATYTGNWFLGDGPGVTFGFAWSLAAEEQFYCGWPWVERYLGGRRAVLVMTGILATGLLIQAGRPPGGVASSFPHQLLLSIPLGICWGVLVAHLLHSRSGFTWAWRLFRFRWTSLALLALLVTLAAGRAPVVVLQPVMALLVASCVVSRNHWLAPLLDAPGVIHIGMISYGLYLLHGLALNGTRMVLTRMGWPDATATLPGFLIALAVAVTAATLSFRYYEAYFQRFRGRFVVSNARPVAATNPVPSRRHVNT